MIVDGHNDLVLKRWRGDEPVHIDLDAAVDTGFAGGFFALYVPGAPMGEAPRPPYAAPLADPIPTEDAARVADELAATLESMPVAIARRADEFVAGRVTAIMHLEGADPLAPDLSDLERWYDRGLRSIGLVWSRGNAFAEGVPFRFPDSPDTGPGLSGAGRALVQACNRLGILVDLSHLNEAGFWDVARLSRAPLVATHSNAHALCASTRNLMDEQLDAIAESGGVVGVNFAVSFLREDGHADPDTPLTEIVRHVDYLADRVGVEHVAFGSDFEGAIVPRELGGVAGLPRLVGALRGRYSEEDVDRITHGNWLRVLDQTWRPWRRYLDAAGDEPRETLLDALGRFASPGLAVDLGCGAGRDTAELARRGWRVLALDGEPESIERLRARDDVDLARVETRVVRFEDVELPPCDLVCSSFALPFATPEQFDDVWARVVTALRPGGRFAGQLFGANDDWAGPAVTTHTRDEVDALLAPFDVERLEEIETNGRTATGRPKHWHVFHVVARKR